MAFNRDITNTDISTHGVVACPDRMTGTAQQNKQRFDELVREVVKEKFNGLIDDLEASTAAGNIGFSSEGYESTNVKDAILEVEELTSESAEEAEEYAKESAESSLVSEGWAKGTQNGTAVTEESPYYHKNAKYYSEVSKNNSSVFFAEYGITSLTEIIEAYENGKELVLYKLEGGSALAGGNHKYYQLAKQEAQPLFPYGRKYKFYFISEYGDGYSVDEDGWNSIDSGKEDKGKVTIGGTTYDIEITDVDPGVGTAGKIIIVTG